MAEYCIGSANGAPNARRADGPVHAVVGKVGTWAPAICGAYVEVTQEPWAQGTHERCEVCLTRAPVTR